MDGSAFIHLPGPNLMRDLIIAAIALLLIGFVVGMIVTLLVI